MADWQAKPLGDLPAPADWVLPQGLQILVKRCFAHFDGSGAAGAFLPTLQILDDAGRTAVEIPMDASVAAGSSVEATWAPFLRSQPAATPTTGGISWAYFSCNGTETNCPSGATTPLTVDTSTFYTNDTASFDLGTLFFPTRHGFIYKAAGHYLILVSCQPDVSPGADQWELTRMTGSATYTEMDGLKGGVTSTAASRASELVTTRLFIANVGSTSSPPPTTTEVWGASVFGGVAVGLELESAFAMKLDSVDQLING